MTKWEEKNKESIPMPFVAACVNIPDEIRPVISKYAQSKTLPARQVQRAKIILLAADGHSNMQISKQVGLGQDSVKYSKLLAAVQRSLDTRPATGVRICLRLLL